MAGLGGLTAQAITIAGIRRGFEEEPRSQTCLETLRAALTPFLRRLEMFDERFRAMDRPALKAIAAHRATSTRK